MMQDRENVNSAVLSAGIGAVLLFARPRLLIPVAGITARGGLSIPISILFITFALAMVYLERFAGLITFFCLPGQDRG